MARTMFDLGFRPGSLFQAHSLGINLKDIATKASQFLTPGTTTPAAVPVQAPKPPTNTILGLPPTVAALGGIAVLGTIAAFAFGHK